MSFKLEEKEMKLEDNNQNLVTERVVLFLSKDVICRKTCEGLFQTKNSRCFLFF